MPTFTYEAMNASGQSQKGELEAANNEEAIAKIRNLGYFPTKVREKGRRRAPKADAAATRRKTAGTGFGRVSVGLLTQFTRQLSTLQDAGLPILRSLHILEAQQRPGKLKNVIKQVGEDVEGGATLSEAMARHPRVYNRLYTNMVAAGEAGGVLDLILQRLADFMEKAQRLRRKVIGAMIYPIVVVSFAVLIVTGIMIVVVPRFETIFSDFDADLPKPTVMLLNMSNWFVHGKPPGWMVVIFSPFLFYLFLKLVRQSKAGRFILDTITLQLPILGNIVGKTAVARFTRTLGTLINAGVPILEAITITRDTIGNEVYARALQQVHDSIREGESFAAPLRASKVCDGLVVNMIDVGEETGDLDKMLIKVADNYEEEVENLVGSLVSLLEPVMVVTLGVIVGFIVIALFLPLVALIQSVSGG